MALISKYFQDLARSKTQTKDLENDLGIQFLAKGIEHKIEQTEKKITTDVAQMYAPTQRGVLLAYNLYKSATIEFKSPLVLEAILLSDDDVVIPDTARFSDGNDVFYSKSKIVAKKDTEIKVSLTCEEVYKNSFTIEDGTVMSYYDTGYSYSDIHGIEVKKGDDVLEYSQNFISWTADYSIEIDPSTEQITVVFLLNNKRGKEIKTGDVVEVTVRTTTDLKEAPNGLAIIDSGYNLVLKDIQVEKNYIPPLTTQALIDNHKHNRYTYGDIVFNENFKELIEKNVSNLEIIKVWQEREENLESGVKLTNINKVFVSYIDKAGLTVNGALDKEIQQVVRDAIHGRDVVFREAEKTEIKVQIIIKTDEPLPALVATSIKHQLSGYYDDINTKINETSFYGLIFKEISRYLKVFELEVAITDKGLYKNKKIYYIENSGITLTVSALSTVG